MIRVQLIAGQRLVHIALKALIEEAPGMDLVAHAFTAQEGLEQLDPSRATMALVALSLEDADGVETIRRLQRQRPQLAIVGFGEPSGGPFPHHMLDAGATAYVSLQAGARVDRGATPGPGGAALSLRRRGQKPRLP